ncbi:hypothetical protein BCR39DRAFT_518436 [Naematelia encephala]|uniref:Uncharacterized protein n=1 Tax=Naematelia encephala TaxID=71784 RepID=A0A1Y2BH13_9TREE|nr:hypothetical protein BCR39DRAFT_518436 [Naematelia encephala]
MFSRAGPSRIRAIRQTQTPTPTQTHTPIQPTVARVPFRQNSQSSRLFPDLSMRPDPRDLVVPPLKERLKPLIPFLFWWTVITSLTTNLLQLRQRSERESALSSAQITVLEGLIEKVKDGQVLEDVEIRKELEMVGLRERTELTKGLESGLEEGGDVGLLTAMLGRNSRFSAGDRKKKEQEDDERAVAEWAEIVNNESKGSIPAAASVPTTKPERIGTSRRPTSVSVYL